MTPAAPVGARAANRAVGAWLAVGLALALPVGERALGDSILLRGGEKLIGKVRQESARKVVFESQTLGRIEVPREQIEKLELDSAAPITPTPAPSQAASPESELSLTHDFVPWVTKTSGSDNFDWIQLKSGEWLKGRMKSMQNDKVEFDSEEMDLQEFEEEDIRTIRLPRLNAVGFETLGPVTGTVLVTTNEVVVMGASTNRYPRSELLAITPTGKKELDKWSGNISAGLTLRSGNTRQVDFNAQTDIHRRTPSTHLSFEFLGNFSSLDGADTANNHRITTEFDYFLSRRLFLFLPFAEYYRDPLQNLEHRLTLGVGVGYDLIKTRRVEWNVTAGPAYQENWYTSVEAGENTQPAALALVLGTKVDIEVTRRLDFLAELRAQVTSKEVGETTYHGLAKLKFEIHKRLNLDVSLIWDRINNPQTDASGVTPLKDDFRLVTGLGIDF
jgi:putative salt-induced outer membrane protein YdiY